jgi:hypothetical protein
MDVLLPFLIASGVHKDGIGQKTNTLADAAAIPL